VLDASPQAKGVVAGMPLAEALSLCPQAALVEPDPLFYRRIFDGVLDAIESLALDVEEVSPGLAYVGLTGVERLLGGRDALVTALLNAVPEHLAPRMGIGGSKFASYVAACIEGDSAQLPVDILPVPWQTTERLRNFGFSTLGQIAALPVGPLQAQFGPTGRLIWELSQGIDPRPLVPRRHEQHVEEWLSFPVPTATIGAITTATEGLLARAFAQTVMRGRFARICTLEATVFRAPPWHKRMVFTQAVGDPHKAAGLVKHTLEGHPPSGPLEEILLTLSGLTGDAGRQESLFNEVRKQENLKETLRQLRARLGMQPPLFHVREVEPWSRLPERRQALVPYAP
jgi:DNA polymerase-4/protein ImuB